MDPDMDKNHDYQNPMSVDTRSIDTAGEIAAAATNAETAPVDVQTVVEQRGNATYKKEVGTFGVLPQLEIPDDHAHSRMLYFKKLAIQTRARRNPLDPMQGGETTAAYKSQQKMAELYLVDELAIPHAQREYDLLVPVAAMAAKALAKTHEIGQLTGYSDKQGPKLTAAEHRGMRNATRAHNWPLDEAANLHSASAEVISARDALSAACSELATNVHKHTLTELLKQLDGARANRAEIEQKIATAQQYVGYLGTLASVVSGGADFLHTHVNPGEPDTDARRNAEHVSATPEDMIGPKRPPPKEATSEPARPGTDLRNADTRDSAAPKVAKGAGVAQRAAGKAGGVIAFGMRLYYETELATAAATEAVVLGLVATHDAETRKTEIKGNYLALASAQYKYQTAVEVYQAKVNDRRKHLATLGHAADADVARRGGTSQASDALLWTASVMETQSFLGTALDQGGRAEGKLNATHQEMVGRRNTPWGTLADIHDVTNVPRRDGMSGSDAKALKEMRQLVIRWVEGAAGVAGTVNKVAEKQCEPILAAIGYTGEY